MSDYEDEYNEENESDEESTETEYLDGKKNVTIILIDVGTSMFDTPRIFKTCLLAIYQVMDQMLLKSYKRNISICLLRDDDIVLTALDANLIESTKTIYELLHTKIDILKTKFERKNPASLRYTLTECIKQFSNLEKINPYIVVLTNDEDPIKGDQTEKLSAIDVALSFKELNVKLVVLPLKEKFNYGIFYKDVLKAANEIPLDIFQEEDEQSYTTEDDLTDILNCIIKDKTSIKRHKFRMYQYGDKGEDQPYFWTQMRYFVKSSHLYKNAVISRANNNDLKQGFKDESSMHPTKLIVEEDENDPLEVSKEDYMYYKMPYGFQLLRVSEEKQSSFHFMLKRGFVLQFDETEKTNKGNDLFNCMWEYCNSKKRYLICGFNSPGNKQHPNLVELSPDTFQSKPCFIGQFLTNCDEIVEDEDEEDEDQNEDDIKDEKLFKNDPNMGLINDMIDKIKLKKYPYHWTDYSYELKATNIKAQFLDIDAEEEEVKSCLPTDEDITKQLGATNTELMGIFGAVEEPAASKRAKK